MRDLYDVLGVPRTASADEVTAAYRRLAKKFHPDRNPGDDEAKAAYAEVDTAYSVLGDPDRRARYDATGDVGDTVPRHDPNAELMAVLVPVMAEALKQMVESGERPDKANMVAYMRRVIELERKKRKTALESLEKARAAFDVAGGRFREPEGEEALLAAAARHHLASVDQQIEQTVAEDKQLGTALEYLARCKYEFDATVQEYTAGHYNVADLRITMPSFFGWDKGL